MRISVDSLKSEIIITATRASGPGGQHVNRTNSGILVRWNLFSSLLLNEDEKQRLATKLEHRLTADGDILVRSESQRDQLRNKEEAVQKLCALIIEGLQVPKYRRKTRPTRSSVRKRIDSKTAKSKIKQNRSKVKDY